MIKRRRVYKNVLFVFVLGNTEKEEEELWEKNFREKKKYWI